MGVLPAIVFYLINAHERFGGWWDKAIWLWAQVDKAPYGPFSLHYLPYNLYTAFFMAPEFQPSFPWMYPTLAGQSLLTTSPALLLALRSKNRLLWLSVLLAMAGALTVWSNGTAQVGARYWMLAYSFLLLLMAEGPIDRLAKILIGTSVLLMAYQVWFLRVWS